MVTVEHLTEPLSQDKLGRLFCPGRPFTIQFETAPGDLPLLQVDSSNLTGGGLEVTIREVKLYFHVVDNVTVQR